jgi:hypothetical protein
MENISPKFKAAPLKNQINLLSKISGNFHRRQIDSTLENRSIAFTIFVSVK